MPIRILELRSVWGTGGGPDKTILAGARLSDSSKYETTVCYLRDARDTVFALDKRAAEQGVPFESIVERHSFDPRVWPALREVVRRRAIDIVHAHDHKTDFLTWCLSKAEPIIPLSTAHGFAGESMNERIYYAVEKRLLARFPRVIAVSQPIKAELVRTGSRPDRVTVINNGIDHRVFTRDRRMSAAVRADLGLAADDVVIGAVGRLEAEKRFDLLIEAVSSLHRRRRPVSLIIVGEGSLRPVLQTLIDRSHLGPSIRLLGHRTDITTLHHAFDLFVQSSEREGAPNAVLEAMAMETPIVATDVGGTRELAAHRVHALLVPRHDVAGLTTAVAEALDDHEGTRARMQAARARVEAELSFDARMRKVEAIYDDLVTARRRGLELASHAN